MQTNAMDIFLEEHRKYAKYTHYFVGTNYNTVIFHTNTIQKHKLVKLAITVLK